MYRNTLVLAIVLLCASAGVRAMAQDGQEKSATEPKPPPALVEYELTIVHLAPVEGSATEDFSAIDLPAALKSWQDKGRLQWTKTMRLSACDNQSAYVQFGEKKPVAAGANVGPRGRTTNYQYEDVGLILGVTGRVESDQSITAELDIKHSDLETSTGDNPSNNEAVDFVPAETHTNQVQTTVRLHNGKTMLIGGAAVASPDEKSQTLLFVSAMILD